MPEYRIVEVETLEAAAIRLFCEYGNGQRPCSDRLHPCPCPTCTTYRALKAALDAEALAKEAT